MQSGLIDLARDLAERAHRGQKRKALGEPYFSHLEAVAGLLAAHGHADEVTIAAAYLHDLVEDQPAFFDEMRRVMPAEVIDTVMALTEPKRDAQGNPQSKPARFDAYVRGLSARTEAVRRALPVSCADKIHNTLSIVMAEKQGEKLLGALKTRPGDHRLQHARLRPLYFNAVNPSLLSAFDDAVIALGSLVRSWFPGRAAVIAAQAHLGQFDKAGAPYIFHPMHLAAHAATVEERTVALLHDVVEDTSWTLAALDREGCSEDMLRALDALTRRDGETYDAFIARVARDRLATRVKLLDLAHNSDLSRIGSPTAADLARVDKYRNAAEHLRRELAKRNLYVRLTAESIQKARALARLEVPCGEHVTLAYRVHPDTLDPRWIPGGHRVGESIELRAVAERADDRVQVLIVEIDGTTTRPFDGGVLHLTVSRAASARSSDANTLLRSGQETPMNPVSFRGTVELVDE